MRAAQHSLHPDPLPPGEATSDSCLDGHPLMASILRFDGSPPGEGRRWLAGVLVSSLGNRADAALVGVAGRGLEARAELAAALSAEIPRETAALLRPFLEGAAVPAATLAAVQAQLAEVEAALLGDLLAQSPPPAGYWRQESTIRASGPSNGSRRPQATPATASPPATLAAVMRPAWPS